MLDGVFLPYCGINNDTREDKSVKVQSAKICSNINYVCACLFVAYCLTLSALSINADLIGLFYSVYFHAMHFSLISPLMDLCS